MLDHTEDSGTQLRKLAEADNEGQKLAEMLIAIGTQLNLADIDVLQAKTPEEKLQRKIIWTEIRGKYKEIQARIKSVDRRISSIKYLIKAERNQF